MVPMSKKSTPEQTGDAETKKALRIGHADLPDDLYSSGSQGVAVWDHEQNLVCWSHECVEFWYKPEAILQPGMPMIDLLRHIAKKGGLGDGDAATLAQTELDRVRQAGPESEDDFRMLGGRLIHVQRSALAGGGHASTYTDITDRQRAVDELKEQLENFQQAERMGNVGHWLWDKVDDRLISCSEEYARIFGITVKDCIEATDSFKLDVGWVHPEDQDRYANTVMGEPGFDIEYRIVTCDGDICHVRGFGEPVFDDNGVVICTRGTLQDISRYRIAEDALAVSEAHYQEIFDEAPATLCVEDWSPIKQMVDQLADDGVTDFAAYIAAHRDWAVDAYNAATVLQTSKASLKLYGAANTIEYKEITQGDSILPEEIDAFIEVLLGLIKGIWTFDLEMMDKNVAGSKFLARTRGIIPPSYRHDWSRLIYSMEDITEKNASKQALRMAKEEAEAANRAKSEFLAHMSHELRTPLNAITGFVQMMMNETFGPLGGPKYREYAGDIYDSGLHLLSLINDILDLSKVEAGEIDVSQTEFPLRRTITECITLVSAQDMNQMGRIHVEPSDNDINLYADIRIFRQVLLNLLSNASKFTPADGKIVISYNKNADDSVAIRIADTGVGIALDDMAKVLEPFGQARQSISTTHEGTGLGLPLSHKLMRLHGGSLALESEIGVGTTVTIVFPSQD